MEDAESTMNSKKLKTEANKLRRIFSMD